MHIEKMKLIKNISLSYEIALNIGSSFDLRDMLTQVLKTIVRKGDAFSGKVWLWNGEMMECVSSAGFHAKEIEKLEVTDYLINKLSMILEAGRPVVKTRYEEDFRNFSVACTENEEEVLLVPVGKLAIIHLSFTYRGASNNGLSGVLDGVAPKLANAILSCIHHNKLLEIERSERKHLEMRYQYLISNVNVGIFISSLEGQFINVNPAFLELFAFDNEQELFEFTWGSLYVDHTNRDHLMNLIINNGYVKNMEILFRRKNGETFWAQVTAVLRRYKEDQTVMGIIEDITERKRFEEQLQYLATHDSLTNIPNRYSLEVAIRQSVEKAKKGVKGALLLIDLDNFKLVNDSLGHAAGDELLITLTKILNANLREGSLLARLGGDEFAVLLEGVNEGEGLAAAERLRRAVDEGELYLSVYRECFNLSISIGIVMIDGTLDQQVLLARADNALYKAKEEGRNRVAFVRPDDNSGMSFSDLNRLISLIKSGLKENRFVLFFQPVESLADRKIIHYEALIRLRSDDGELVFPNAFIPVAERFGLMPQIDRWLVQAALKTLQEYPKIKLFVNLSGVSLGDEALLEFIENNINQSRVDPCRLGFEITETAAVKDMLRAERWICKLKEIGCRFALDDFGKGFSSFSYLRVLPLDYIKIDGSFVHNIHTNLAHHALVQAMHAVASNLGKKTIAEFVENEDVLRTLQELQVEYGQGYFLGKPAPVPEITK